MRDDPRLLPLLATVLLRAGCAGPQSALDPACPSASSNHRLGIVMYVGATLVTLLVTVLMLVPFLRRRERRANHNLFLWGGGVVLPGLTLTALAPYVLSVGGEMRTPALSDHLTVDVTGHVYWWEMSYRRPDGLAAVTSANEVRLPVGEPVEVFLRAADVIHSFWVPNLAGKTDMIPGRVNRMVLQADRSGVCRGQYAEYCGAQHALIAFDVILTSRAGTASNGCLGETIFAVGILALVEGGVHGIRTTLSRHRASGGRTAGDVRFPHRDAHPHASTGGTADAAGGDSPWGGSGRGAAFRLTVATATAQLVSQSRPGTGRAPEVM